MVIEKEFKILITEGKYHQLRKLLIWDNEFFQENYYFDTDDFYLYKNNYTFRVRKVNSNYKLQIKYPNSSGNKNYHTRIEKEYVIKHLKKEAYFHEIKQLVHMVGCLKTYRNVLQYSSDIAIFLDKNLYLGIIDYEIEIEFNCEENRITELLTELEINSSDKAEGKYSRFIKRTIYNNYSEM